MSTAGYPFWCPHCGSFNRRNWAHGGCRYFDDWPEGRASGADPPCVLEDYDMNMDARRWRGLVGWTCAAFVALAALLALILAGPAGAQTKGEWFKSLKQPETGFSCCDISDCKRTEADWKDGQWWADVNGAYTPIPPDKELDVMSFDGEAYVCNSPNGKIYCFIKPGMGS